MLNGMSRRSFCKALAISAVTSSALGQDKVATTGTATEWSYSSGKQYSDPFNQVDVDVIVTTPQGHEERVPAFWAGGSIWRVRYAPPVPGTYRLRSVCSDTANKDLHNVTSVLNAEAYTGENPHYKNGVLKVAHGPAPLRICQRHSFFLARGHVVDGSV